MHIGNTTPCRASTNTSIASYANNLEERKHECYTIIHCLWRYVCLFENFHANKTSFSYAGIPPIQYSTYSCIFECAIYAFVYCPHNELSLCNKVWTCHGITVTNTNEIGGEDVHEQLFILFSSKRTAFFYTRMIHTTVICFCWCACLRNLINTEIDKHTYKTYI
jgi:hypothetical protein